MMTATSFVKRSLGPGALTVVGFVFAEGGGDAGLAWVFWLGALVWEAFVIAKLVDSRRGPPAPNA